MIVRIQGEGQYELADDARQRLDELDAKLFDAVRAGETDTFASCLKDTIRFVEGSGEAVPHERLVPSDIILPASDTSLEEAQRLLTDEGYLKPVEA